MWNSLLKISIFCSDFEEDKNEQYDDMGSEIETVVSVRLGFINTCCYFQCLSFSCQTISGMDSIYFSLWENIVFCTINTFLLWVLRSISVLHTAKWLQYLANCFTLAPPINAMILFMMQWQLWVIRYLIIIIKCMSISGCTVIFSFEYYRPRLILQVATTVLILNTSQIFMYWCKRHGTYS